MTNEQLALFLKQIAWRIRQLSANIEPFITDGIREDVKVWVGEGDPPIIPLGKGWETRPEGQLTAVQMVEEFAINLENEAESLVSNNHAS